MNVVTGQAKIVPVRRTRTEDLRLQLADDIVRGIFAPGVQLDEVGLAARYGVSRTPVREALRQLSASGLVEIRPHRGAIVTRLSEERLMEMFIAMAELESICAGLAAEAMSVIDRRELEARHRRLAELVREGDPARYAEGNESFHSAIYAGAHNSYLAELTLATRARLAPFRRAQFRRIGRLSESFDEHERVVEAILRGDRLGAMAAMREHIGTVKDAFDRYVEGL
ncbi:GntR family transcriptional regulator [Kaistia dalseonensis]|uniref:DNA-binding GntR family transcriptional regulator n=1 Tax=Kaistia dalseonensis TaxID=410840 RepID=A0ABU0H9F3_9HYPH|nr:GntR family transcriptional regulator [Kaistia dalseonensis]MCX5496297.1 GntR family transcriptional regulator [Kaistia dalseonensis]MDQ0438915.1 DNA-binding GntR family transcriptional regulator [Kaistia dalseonensis]